MNFFKDKTILVTGGTGSIGSEIVRQLLKYKPKQVRILSRNDSKQYHLLERLGHPKNIRTLIGDIRDSKRLDLAFENVDIVFHAAALKHVPICEYNPLEAMKTNVFGSQNIIDAAFKNGVSHMIAISTDKAANPGNVMGLSKLMMEKLFTNTSSFSDGKTRLSCVRFGNVVWSEASVLPLWRKQADTKKKISLMDKEATRFFMSIEQAVKLIFKAVELSQGGEIFVLKMPSIKMLDLANMFLKKYYHRKKIKIELAGARVGDKTHEELFDLNDSQKLIIENESMFIILPKEAHQKSKIYPAEFKKASYENFEVSSKSNYASRDYLNNKAVEKII